MLPKSVSASQWLYDRINYETLASPRPRYRFTLDRMRSLMDRLGHGRFLSAHANQVSTTSTPSAATTDGPIIIHIAGTKGKGSVATMVASMLTASGLTVGLYTSPHLVALTERFRVDGKVATETELAVILDRIRPVVESMESSEGLRPSFFELTTAIAAEHFLDRNCDVWVLETGLGGRLDSTSVFQSNVTAITTIGLDHQHVLGDTLEAIAREKAGIIKPSVPLVSGVSDRPARDVIHCIAKEMGSTRFQLGDDFEVADWQPRTDWGSRFRASGLSPVISESAFIELAIEGKHQAINAAVALAIIQQLYPEIQTNQTDVTRGLAHVQTEARLERFIIDDQCTVILDAAHNPDSIAALTNVIQSRLTGHEVGIVFGTSTDKDVSAMLSGLAPYTNSLWLTRYTGNPRFVPVEALQNHWNAVPCANETAVHADSDCGCALESAIQWCRESANLPRTVIICGSFFLAAELRANLIRCQRN